MTTQEREALAVENLALAAHVARKWARRGSLRRLRPDLEAEARAALWDAARTFDPSLGFRFTTYAWRCITNALVSLTRRELKQEAKSLPLVLEEAPQAVAALSVAARPDAGIVSEEVSRDVAGLLSHLPAADRRLLTLRFLRGLTCREVALRLGVSHPTVCNRVKAALRRARLGVA